ncbi:class I adenylate-forming enzyme family protein [Tropicibacter sp. Alg240-R139]|uniref:class I adenylate-forming enzyme family protein n=1 Tax=Tropicibacter sp. Alg240-R139 TaxID=2305991 RepID=UPI0013E097CE|nr:class I adenylate-forming enzyme family protein [Tropicibacter sp. Alg240-R139]
MKNRIHELLIGAAEAGPNKLAVIDHDDTKYAWGDVLVAANEAAAMLKARGVKPGDRVVIVGENCIEVVAFFFGTGFLDASVVSINARSTAVELDRILSHSDPSAVVFPTRLSKAARDHAQRFETTQQTGAFGAVDILTCANASPEQVFDDPAEQVALLLYTSGTTGTPKAAMLTHQNLYAAALCAAQIHGVQENDVNFLVLPLSHVFGVFVLMTAAYGKTALRLEAQFTPQRLFDALNQDVTLLSGVPQMHAHLFNYAQAHGMPRYNAGKLRFVASGGAPLDASWKWQAEEFYGIPMQNGYGLTESTAGVCATNSEMGDTDVSAGPIIGANTMKLDFAATGASPDDGVGEILLGGPQITKGYFRDPEQTAMAFDPDGYFRTGDLGRLDEQERLHIVGRSKELIIRSGFNVYPAEVEAALTEHPEVVLAAVVGRKVKGNEEVMAFVSARPGCVLTEQALKNFLQDRLAPYKQPSRIVAVDALPTAPTGKIMKSELLTTFAEQLAEHEA